MGMSIDEAKQLLSYYQKLFNSLNGDYKLSQVQAAELSHSIVTVLDAMRRYQMIELDHKADMVAMLTEIQLEIEEKKFLESSCSFMDKTEEKNYAVYTDDISEIIQQKIDDLKGIEDEN